MFPPINSGGSTAKKSGLKERYLDRIDAFVEKYRYSGVREQLDAVYELNPEASHLEPEVEELQAQSIIEEDW